MQLRRSHFSTAGISKNPVHQKFYTHFFIDNSNANISLYALSCPNLDLGQLKVCKLMFALELSMKKWIKKIWIAGFSVIPAINAFGFSKRKFIKWHKIWYPTVKLLWCFRLLRFYTSLFWRSTFLLHNNGVNKIEYIVQRSFLREHTAFLLFLNLIADWSHSVHKLEGVKFSFR